MRHPTWRRLAPFIRLPGQILWGKDTLHVELRPFHDRHLTCDLAVLCQRVEAAYPRLPDTRTLVLRIARVCHLPVAAHHERVA